MSDVLQTVPELNRKYSDFGSVKGLKKDILPWKLWEKAKKLMWDPADIDYTKDAEQWAGMPIEQKLGIIGLARGFMVGEEGVTLDILPLIMATADEGRTEDTMFLTTFAFEEAKHVDFFRRWMDAIGVDLAEMDKITFARMRERGVEPPTDENRSGLFQHELPRVMRRLITDRSPQAFLDAAVTYNQFVEGCLAIAGYRVWNQAFHDFGVMPGLQEGLTLVQRDERRHIAYGTYLCRRLLSQNPDLFDWAKDRMHELREGYFRNVGTQAGYGGGGDGQQAQRNDAARGATGNGRQAGAAQQVLGPFVDYVLTQVDRRIELLAKARYLKPEEVESGLGGEEEEEELQNV